jgi:hypothetical protein
VQRAIRPAIRLVKSIVLFGQTRLGGLEKEWAVLNWQNPAGLGDQKVTSHG